MFIYPQKDGSVTWTGSFNQAEWDAWQAEHPTKAKVKAEAKAGPNIEGTLETGGGLTVGGALDESKPAESKAPPPAKKVAAPAAKKGGGS